jgi:peroxiredoxin
LVIQQNDTLIKEIDKVLALTKNATEVRKFIIYRLASTYEIPKYLNIDGVFIHLVKQYYVNEPSLWDSSTVKKMSDRVKVLEPLITGKKMPNMLLSNQLGQEKPLYSINSKYTIVFAYDPDCAHCKESMPVLLKMQPALQKRGANIYAVSVSHNLDRWKAFIKQFKTESLTNVADATHSIDYRNTFDIQNTPTIYVLDANKNIIGKRIVVDQLENFLAYYERTKQ